MTSPPIDEKSYLMPQVVDIGDLRVARGKTRRPRTSCRHRMLVYDTDERRVWCKDCESEVDSFDAFLSLVRKFQVASDALGRRETAIEEAESFVIRRRATMVLDKLWRSRTLVPLCPHCRRGILPEDVSGGLSQMSKELEIARRKKANTHDE